MKKIKILHVLSDTNIGGAGRLLYNLFTTIDKDKFEFVFVFPKESALCNLFRSENAKVYEIDSGKDTSFCIKACFEMARIIRRVKPDIVHTHSSLYGRIGAKIALIDKKNIIYTKHCVFGVPESRDNGLSRYIYCKIDDFLSGKVVAVAESAKSELEAFGVDPNKIQVIINGTPSLIETSKEQRRELKKELGIHDDTFVVGISARLEKYKGHKTVIEAAELFKKEGIDDIIFLIMGSGSYDDELKDYSKKLQVTDRILFLGFKEEVYKYVNVFDVNLNCSTGTETSSLAISEGLSIGKPIIATDFGGNPNMVIDGKTGYLFEQKNAKELFNRIKKIKDNPFLFRQMSSNARDDYAERFSAKKMALQYEKLYFNIKTNQSVR